ncbi:MAG TPA: AAA family ATPase [Porphyromonadaceae bacterium]|nr:AAA family ATPase [Porphyromonadaceae bacterium]
MIRNINETQPGIAVLRIAYDAANDVGRKIFVIIDEYDHFANDLIAMGVDAIYKKQVRANGIVRDFYETLKIGTSDAVGRIFITGISPVMIDDLTSGFNIASNLTVEERYNEMLGFTQAEVEGIIKETGLNRKLAKVDIQNYYDGYKFHKDAPRRVYNPTMLLYYFNQLRMTGKEPENIIDDNLKTDYGRLQRLTMNRENRETLLQIIRDDGIYSEIKTKFSIDNLADTGHFVSLLFYMGLLTIDKADRGLLWLKIPNYSIRTIYWEYLMQMIADTNREVQLNLSEWQLGVRDLAYDGNGVPLLDYVSKNIFSKLSNRDLMRFDEKYIKVMLLSVLFQSKIYLPFSEREVEGGYIDIFLERSSHLPDIPYEWIIELKYVKESDTDRLPEIRKASAAQLERYAASPQLAGKPGLRKAVWLFIGKTKYEIIE